MEDDEVVCLPDKRMENDNDVFCRPDGRFIHGLSKSDWIEYKEMYPHLLDEELFQIMDFCEDGFDRPSFEITAAFRNARKADEKKNGKVASLATSLFMLISVHVKRKNSSSLSVFGEITSFSAYNPKKKMDIYKRESHDPEIFSESDDGDDGVYLTLNGPSDSCSRDEACNIFGSRKLSVRLYDQPGQHLLVDVDNIMLDYSPDDFEHVKDKVVENTEISLTLKYVSIPLALYGYLDIRISKGVGCTDKFVNVCGKVVAQYQNTLGNYDSEKIVLFHKDSKFKEYQSVGLNMESNLLSSSRCWMVAPAYSLLRLDIHLFDSKGNTILIKQVELETGNAHRFSKDFTSDGYFISVSSSWLNAFQLPEQDVYEYRIDRCHGMLTPIKLSAVEVFSVVVCDEKCMPFQIHGHLQFNTIFASEDFIEEGFDIFKRDKEVPLTLSGRGDAIPLLNGGSWHLSDTLPVSIICDLKGTTGLSIKGYQIIRDDRWFDKLLCSVFRGDHGFAALYFIMFRSAVRAHLNVFVRRKGSQCAVFGSIFARYKSFDYSSRYKKNWYNIVIFKKSKEDLVWMDGSIPGQMESIPGLVDSIPGRVESDGSIPFSVFEVPLSRRRFFVPSYSSCRFYLDLTIGTEKFIREVNIAPDTPAVSIKGRECEVSLECDFLRMRGFG